MGARVGTRRRAGGDSTHASWVAAMLGRRKMQAGPTAAASDRVALGARPRGPGSKGLGLGLGLGPRPWGPHKGEQSHCQRSCSRASPWRGEGGDPSPPSLASLSRSLGASTGCGGEPHRQHSSG